jgi:biopolymer transport protein ExbD
MQRRPLFDDGEDEGRFRRRKSNSEMELDITPMIDVTFLLLIFFMVASTMQPTAENDIPPAKHGVGIETEYSTVISIRLPDADDAAPIIYLGEGGTKPVDVNDELDDKIEQHVKDGFKKGRSRVIIKADRSVRHGFVQRVARAANSVDGIRFFIGVQDKNRQ